MADGPRYSVPFRRRREGRTDYKLRRALVRSGKPRAVVRVTNKYVYVQITDAERRALAKGVKEAVLDIGLKSSTKGSKLFAVLKGLSDAGLEVPHSDGPLPGKDRIGGVHISEYAKKLSGETDVYRKTFSGYLKRGLKPEELSNHFEQVRQQIQSAQIEAKA